MGAVAGSTGAMGERGMIPQTEQEHWEMLLTKKGVLATSVWPTVHLLWFFSGVRNGEPTCKLNYFSALVVGLSGMQ